MNKREKEVFQNQLDKEKAVMEQIKKQYDRALKDIEQKTKGLMFDIQQLDEALNTDGLDDRSKEVLESRKRTKIYQKQQQDALKKQVGAITEKLHSDNYSTIEQYLKECYTDAYIGTMYDIAGQGIPIIMPIDQAAVVRAVTLDSKISNGLYSALGVDTKALKTAISAEISRGIATGQSYATIARNLTNVSKAGFSNAMRIVRTEGHRIQNASTYDAQQAAKSKGCEVVKQWDSTLDGKTRPTHRELDGQIREVEEYFEVAGKKAKYPGDFNDPAEDCNCRCASLTRARWALDEDELKALQDRAKFFGLDKTKDFTEYKAKYLGAAEQYRRKVADDGHEIIDKPTYQKLTKSFLNSGGIIVNGEEAAKHLGNNAYASYVSGMNVAFVRDDATISDVLEEMYHAEQDRKNMFGSALTEEVRLKREIDAQNYLLSLTKRYKIPSEEVEVTKQNLEYYEGLLEKLLKGSD